MRPLTGITVVAVEQAVAAPICTRHLGDRSYFTWANRNKESVALDLKHPLGREALGRLVRTADVLVQNLAPGAAARLGLDPAVLRAERPELITVGI